MSSNHYGFTSISIKCLYTINNKSTFIVHNILFDFRYFAFSNIILLYFNDKVRIHIAFVFVALAEKYTYRFSDKPLCCYPATSA